MRQIKTFILRLYIDAELPQQICGDLQILPERKTFPFKNTAELLGMVRQLAYEQDADLPLRALPDESEPG